MAVFSKGARGRRRWFLTLSLVSAIAVVAIGVVLWQAVGLSSVSSVSERMAQAKPYLSGLRLTLIGLLAILWPRLPALWARDDDAIANTKAAWMALRWRVVGWLLILEVILGQDLIGRFVTATTGPIV